MTCLQVGLNGPSSENLWVSGHITYTEAKVETIWIDKVIALLHTVTPDDFNKVVLGAVALIAMVVSPIVQWQIAKRQANLQEQIAKTQAELHEEIAKRQLDTQGAIAKRQAADNISSKRQVWIDELRKDAAEFLTVIARVEELRRPGTTLSPDDQRKNFDEMAIANARSHELGIRIKLRLNAREDEHNELVRLIGVLVDGCGEPPANETLEQKHAAQVRFATARGDVVSHLQVILKHEWERVKRGDV
ncbi:hypothetical protein ACFQNJ_15040 [Hydrogenophaga bisanensis]|uniref:Uncharacterized protein n=1 Tax=Hydrogenophaga bisanensis TaxID=439611 RepID=A0ABW2RCQ0_9BURK